MSRTVFATYLLYPIIIQSFWYNHMAVPLHFSDYKFIILSFGFIVLSVVAGFVFYVLIERPIRTILKKLLIKK